MEKHILTPGEKVRLKSIWHKSLQENAVFDRYDMNFVLSFINEDSDLIEQALGLKDRNHK